jgi:choice-of-anchor A domain-containing protein
MRKIIFLAATAVASLSVAAEAAPVAGTNALREWNLVVLGDLRSSSEVEGRTFVGGNLTGNSSNYQIKAPAASPSGQPGLTVVGNVTGGTKNLNNGSGAIVGGNVESGFNLNGGTQTVRVGGTIANTNVNQNTVQSGLGSSGSFSADLAMQKSVLSSSLIDLSQGLNKLTSNSTAAISGNRLTLNAAPDAKGVAVFSLTAAQLDSIGEIQFNLNGADTAVVNVSGANIHLNDNFLGGTGNLGEHVIWNFADAASLDLTTAWGGSLLAPKAAATTANYIQGSAVFGSLVQDGEMHLGTYTGNYNTPSDPGSPVAVPAPSMWIMFLLAVGGLIFGRRFGRTRPVAA